MHFQIIFILRFDQAPIHTVLLRLCKSKFKDLSWKNGYNLESKKYEGV